MENNSILNIIKRFQKTRRFTPVLQFFALILILTGLLLSCGFEEETNFIPEYYNDKNPPTIISINPQNNGKIGMNTEKIDITFSEEVLGAEEISNYSLSGEGVGTLVISNITYNGSNQYSLYLEGVPSDGEITLNINNITDLAGNEINLPDNFTFKGWWNTNWAYRKKLTFDNSGQTEDLLNFPVMVRLDDSRINYQKVQDNGEDIRFVNSDGTELPYEIEKWDEDGDSIIWVKVPKIDGSSNSDYINMYYGNSNANDGQDAAEVWNSSYSGVWHLNEASGGPYNDSTGNGHTGTGEGTMTHIDNGAVDGAQDSDAGADRINININLGPTVTIEAWAKLDTLGDMLWCIDNDDHGPDLWFHTNGNIYLNTWDSTNNPFGPQPDNVNLWHYYVTIINSSDTHLYIDGQSGGTAEYRNPTETIIYIGSSSTGYTWDGSVDEFRISNDIKSPDWIKAQYLSMSDTFITYGQEED